MKLERSVEPVPVSWERERRRGMEHFSEGVFEYEMFPQPYDADAAAGAMGTTTKTGGDDCGGEDAAGNQQRPQRQHRRRVIRIAESFEQIGHRVRVCFCSW